MLKKLIGIIFPKTNELEHYRIEIDFINIFSRKGQDNATKLEDLLFHLNIPTHFYDQRENYFYVSLVKRTDVKRLEKQDPRTATGSIEDIYEAVKKAGYNPRKPVKIEE